MKFLIFLSSIILLLFFNNVVTAQSWLWSNQISGIENVTTEAVGIDSLDNVYVLVELYGSVDISGNIKTSYGDKDLLLVKYNKNGVYQWAKVAGNNLIDDPKGLFVDKAGNSYLTGSFEGDAKFDNDSVSAYSNKDAFIAKYFTNGGLDWVINAGWGTNVQKGIDLTVDDNGDISVIGQFQDFVIFGDSVGAANCDTLTSNGKKNYYYAKFDNSGKYISSSARHFICTNNSVALTSIGVCSNNEYYIAGHIKDTVFYGLGALQDTIVSNGGFDIAVYKIDNSGNLGWSKNYGDASDDYCWGMSIDEMDNGYITGYYLGSLPMDLFNITSIDNFDIYTSKFENINGDVQWLLSKGSTGVDYGEGISAKNNMVQIAGSFTDTLFWNSDTLVSSSSTNQDAFFGVYDYLGNELKAEKIETAVFQAEDKSQDIVIDNFNNTYLAGYFKSDTIFVGLDTLENAFSGKTDIFVAKFGCTEVSFTYILDTVSCSGGNDGEIIIQPSFVDNFIYSWSTFDTNDTITNISEGWHYVSVTNYYGCSYIDSVEMVSMPPLQTTVFSDSLTLKCIASNNGIGIVTPINGVGPFTYSWSSSLSIDSIATDLTVGTHYVTVTDACNSVEDTINVGYMPTLYLTMSSHSIIVLCAASTNGEATVTAHAGVGLFDYQWSSGVNETLATNSNLPVGLYYVTVTDGCNVPTIDSVQVNYFPTMNASIMESEQTSCINSTDGYAYIFATSGVPPYSYEWDNGITTASNNTLDTGMAYVTVTDFCITIVDSVLITSNPAMTLSITSQTDVTCPGNSDGTAAVTPVNGVPPFTYEWDGTTDTDSLVTDLSAGTWTVTVTGTCGSQTASVTIGSVPQLSATISSHSILILCETSTDGEATVYPVDGVAPYNYIWTNGDTTSTSVTLTIGKHYVTITDGCGNTVVDSVQVNFMAPMNAAITNVVNATCSGYNDGSAQIFATGGVPPYSYEWSNGSTSSHNDTLSAGWAIVTVTDFCITIIDSALVSTNSPLAITISSTTDVSCPGDCDGQATVGTSNGAPPYFYQWSGSSSTNSSVSDVCAGIQYVTVSDGCGSSALQFYIGTKTPLTINLTLDESATCTNSNNGIATVHLSDGSSPFTFVWQGSVSTDSVANDLSVGVHYITVTDACGDHVDSVTVTSITPLSVTNVTSNVLCNADTSGYIVLIPANGVVPYSYSWSHSNLEIDSIGNGLSAGTYFYTVTDFCGSVYNSVSITEPGAMSYSFIVTDQTFTGTFDGKIDLIVSGGVAPYSFIWSNDRSSEDIINLSDGIYTVTISDFNSCKVIDSAAVVTKYKYIEVMNAFTPNGDGTNDEWTIKYIDQYPNCKVDVFNQWGMNVFSSNGYSTKWNGKKDNSGSDLPASAYYYIIDLGDDSDQYTGSVTIIR
ncbi:MAG: gliding motility-associated C-terminal domain-containing protein [Bacteroidota bacterium]